MGGNGEAEGTCTRTSVVRSRTRETEKEDSLPAAAARCDSDAPHPRRLARGRTLDVHAGHRPSVLHSGEDALVDKHFFFPPSSPRF